MSTNAIPFFRLTGYLTRNARYSRKGKTSQDPYPVYKGIAQDLLGLIDPTPRLASFDGTIYSAFSENSLILTIKASKILAITSCPSEWKGTPMMKPPTVNMIGHRLFWTMGGPCRRESRSTRRARDPLQSGSLQCSSTVSYYHMLEVSKEWLGVSKRKLLRL